MIFKYLTPSNYLLSLSVVILVSCSKSRPVPAAPIQPDIPSVTICSHTWMTKNLDVVTFRNGDTIPYVEGVTNWRDLNFNSPRTPGWCYFLDNSANDSVYGKLYNWAAAIDPRGLAPDGWHVATYEEWRNLVDSCLGGPLIAGKKMKEEGYAHWPDYLMSDIYPTNSSGLTCLPGGYLSGTSFDNPLGMTGNWWCDNRTNNSNPNMMWLYHVSNEVYFDTVQDWAMSVRCVKD